MQHETVMDILRDPLAQELLHSSLLARLGYNGADGAPRVVPVGYVWNGSTFIVCTAVQAPKVRALASNAKVALSIDTDTQPPHVLLVRGIAAVDIVDGVPDEFLEASEKSLPRDQWPQFEAQIRSIYSQMARITIEPEWAKLLDFETRLPIAVEWLVRGTP
ncbi:MAG: pyridoxamine 5'-phosphate oxidase family protein [Actinomycetota bacterium]|nr:pyridoxamine 5'-phosphate oxidase family protein [Actinomycetota bacterium]